MSTLALKRILCAVDLGPATGLVLGWAGLLARPFAAHVEVLHAEWIELPRYFTPAQIQALGAEAEESRARLREELAEMARRILGPQAEPTLHIVEGHPVPLLLQYARQFRPELMVLGSHGRSGVARLMLGSVAENVVRESPCPTLIARGGAEAPERITRILCPVNFTESGRQCLETSAALATATGASLEVLHASEETDARIEVLRDTLCQWVPHEARRGCQITEVVRRGNPAEQIILQVREHPVDLVVLTGEHRPLLELTTLGTTTERVMRHSPCSVLVLPRETPRE
ncbi:MAG TPA: universal stress protein [Candidatus Acidoferrales bacterium]|nr:universal stress protein [Candidatus Acidoferrales bacterium]